MAGLGNDFATFQTWELRACGEVEPKHPFYQLTAEIRLEWSRIPHVKQAEYVETLRNVTNSLQDCSRLAARIRRCQRSVIDARFAYPYSTDPEAVNRRRQLKGALVSALECLRVCFEALQALQDEQDEQDELRVFLSNQRFMGYTTALLDRTREQILDAEHELGECRQWLRQHGESDPGTASPAADDQFGGLHVSLRQTGAQTMRAIPACTNSFDELYDVTPGQTQASRSAAASQQQAGNHAGQTVAKSPPKQRTKVPAAMAAGAPGQPDDDSSDSSDRREKPKRPHVDAHSPKRKRSADEGSSLDMRKGSRGGSSKFSKRSPTSAGHEADTGRTTERIDKWDLMLTLPEDVQMYYVQASEDGERLGLDQGDVLDMVLRLQAARGGDKDWIWPPISEILGPDGPKTGGAAMAVLERAERAEAVGAWNRFLDSISEDPGHEVYWDLYNDLRDHLALIESAMKPPTLPTDQAPAEIFNQWRRKVINIENPYIEAEWSAYIDHLEREGDAFKLESARNRYGNVMSRIAQGTEVCWPPKRPWTMLANAKSDGPPSGRRSTTPRYNTADFGRMATNIGFDTAKFGGRWTFLETAGTGAFGHAGLWVQYDSAARIIGRKIIKETYLKRRRDWDDAAVWLPPNLHKWPREAGIQGKLSMLAQAFNIVQLQTYKVYEEKRMYRLYMEYCEHSDLSTLITNHRALQLRGAVDQEGNPVQL